MARLEITTFRLGSGVSEADFLVADKRVQSDFFYQQPGVVRRTTARGDEGEWLVILLWASESQAAAASARSSEDGAVAAFDALVDAGSVNRRQYSTLD